MYENMYTLITEGSMNTIPITTARQEFLDLPEAVQDEPVFITRHGRPVMTLLSMEQFEGMLETIEILSDQVFAKRLKVSIGQARSGKTISLEDAAARLGL